MDATGAGIGVHVRPASAVRMIAAQDPLEQVPFPSTQPSVADTNVAETGLSPRIEVGAADAPVDVADGAGEATEGDAEAAGVAVGALAVGRLPDPFGCPPGGRFPFRVTISAATATTTTAAAARFTAARAARCSPPLPADGDGCRAGISPIRATRSSGACSSVEARSEARTSRSKDSSLFMA
jgi:hypothetical protein